VVFAFWAETATVAFAFVQKPQMHICGLWAKQKS